VIVFYFFCLLTFIKVSIILLEQDDAAKFGSINTYVNIVGVSYSPSPAKVRSGLEGSVVAFDICGFTLTLYSDMPVPEGFHGNTW
jgi:hypothetical protein